MLFPDIPCFNLCMQSSLQLVLVPWKQAPCSYATLPGQALSAQRSMQQTPAGFANAPAVCDDITRRVLALPQVVVVVTSRWDVLCFDHNLRLMWTGRVKVSCAFPAPHMPNNFCRHKNPSVSISTTRSASILSRAADIPQSENGR